MLVGRGVDRLGPAAVQEALETSPERWAGTSLRRALQGRLRGWLHPLEMSSPNQTWTSSPGPQRPGNSVTFRKPQLEVCDSFHIALAHIPVNRFGLENKSVTMAGTWAVPGSHRNMMFIFSSLMYVIKQS